MTTNLRRFGVGIFFFTLVMTGAGCPKKTLPERGEETKQTIPEITPALSVNNQDIIDGKITVASVSINEPAWIVIHADANGQPGDVIGYTGVNRGTTERVVVVIDQKKATPQLFAMLHTDIGALGTYEFPGVDTPKRVDEKIIVMAFTVANPAMMNIQERVTSTVNEEKVDSKKKEVVEKKDANVVTERIIRMTAKQWEFTPDTITVTKGDKIKLQITSIDVTHGFSLPEFNVNATLEPNNMSEVTFTPDKTGTFNFFCNVFCGEGHGGMRGTIVVEEEQTK